MVYWIKQNSKILQRRIYEISKIWHFFRFGENLLVSNKSFSQPDYMEYKFYQSKNINGLYLIFWKINYVIRMISWVLISWNQEIKKYKIQTIGISPNCSKSLPQITLNLPAALLNMHSVFFFFFFSEDSTINVNTSRCYVMGLENISCGWSNLTR